MDGLHATYLSIYHPPFKGTRNNPTIDEMDSPPQKEKVTQRGCKPKNLSCLGYVRLRSCV